MPNIKDVQCPTCGKKDTFKETNPFRPFCSDRCKLIDLGDWADESRKIPGETINPDNLENDNEE